MAIFLGLDGGGSKTTCAIGDESSLLGSGTAGGSNILRVGQAQAREAIVAAIRQACAVANVTPDQIKRACVGVAGAARPEVNQSVRRLVAEVISGEIEVVGDMVTTLEAAFGAGAGIVAIAGTGSIAYGRDSAGNTARAGGWGFAISDEGSGHWIGRSAIAAALRDQDEAPSRQSALLAAVMKLWRVENLEQFIVAANSSPPPDFAALLPAVLAVADAGDPLARNVLTRAGAELAGLARIVIQRLLPDTDVVPVAMSGGVFRHSALVRQVFYNSLRSDYPKAAITPTVVDPVRGALELARKHHRS